MPDRGDDGAGADEVSGAGGRYGAGMRNTQSCAPEILGWGSTLMSLARAPARLLRAPEIQLLAEFRIRPRYPPSSPLRAREADPAAAAAVAGASAVADSFFANSGSGGALSPAPVTAELRGGRGASPNDGRTRRRGRG